jgi:hypothetical protein
MIVCKLVTTKELPKLLRNIKRMGGIYTPIRLRDPQQLLIIICYLKEKGEKTPSSMKAAAATAAAG